MNIFNRKFPCDTSFKSHFIRAVAFGIFVLLFLWIFKPFHLDTLPAGRLFFVCSMYGLAVFATLITTALVLPWIFSSYFNEERWTTGRQILLIAGNVVLVGLVNYLISPLIVSSNFSLRSLLWSQGVTLMVSLLPITIYTLVKQNILLRRFQQQASHLEKKLQDKLDPDRKQDPPHPTPEKKNESSVIELIGDYQGEKIILPPHELYLIAAANNYVKVYFTKNNKLSYSIIRMTMKKAEEALQPWPDFFRCHRAYIINLDKVQHVEGNAQGYKVRMDGLEEAIPVSRSLNNEFSDKLLAIRNNIN